MLLKITGLPAGEKDKIKGKPANLFEKIKILAPHNHSQKEVL
jgi:hypothetical protein